MVESHFSDLPMTICLVAPIAWMCGEGDSCYGIDGDANFTSVVESKSPRRSPDDGSGVDKDMLAQLLAMCPVWQSKDDSD
jgi:hypothetical protein